MKFSIKHPTKPKAKWSYNDQMKYIAITNILIHNLVIKTISSLKMTTLNIGDEALENYESVRFQESK